MIDDKFRKTITMPFEAWSLLLQMARENALDFEERTSDLKGLQQERDKHWEVVKMLDRFLAQ